MSLTQALNTATAGLQITQKGLSVVAGNIANAQTPGYVRKTLDQISTAAGTSISVRAEAINRELDRLIQTQLITETSGGSYADMLSKLYQQLQGRRPVSTRCSTTSPTPYRALPPIRRPFPSKARRSTRPRCSRSSSTR